MTRRADRRGRCKSYSKLAHAPAQVLVCSAQGLSRVITAVQRVCSSCRLRQRCREPPSKGLISRGAQFRRQLRFAPCRGSGLRVRYGCVGRRVLRGRLSVPLAMAWHRAPESPTYVLGQRHARAQPLQPPQGEARAAPVRRRQQCASYQQVRGAVAIPCAPALLRRSVRLLPIAKAEVGSGRGRTPSHKSG